MFCFTGRRCSARSCFTSLCPYSPSKTFAAPGAALDVDGHELRVEGASEPSVFAGEGRNPSKHRYVVAATVTNRPVLPVRWGPATLTAELLDAAGRAVKAYPDVIHRAAMRSWSGGPERGRTVEAALTR